MPPRRPYATQQSSQRSRVQDPSAMARCRRPRTTKLNAKWPPMDPFGSPFHNQLLHPMILPSPCWDSQERAECIDLLWLRECRWAPRIQSIRPRRYVRNKTHVFVSPVLVAWAPRICLAKRGRVNIDAADGLEPGWQTRPSARGRLIPRGWVGRLWNVSQDSGRLIRPGRGGPAWFRMAIAA